MTPTTTNTIGDDSLRVDEKTPFKSNDDVVDEKKIDESAIETVPVSYFQLYRYCNPIDVFIQIAGVIFALLNGACMPTFAIIFGEMADTLGQLAGGADVMVDVRKWAFIILGLAGASWIFSYISTVCFFHMGERLSERIQYHYIQSLLRNEMAWFDKSHPSEFISRFRSDAKKYHDAVGERVNLLLFNGAAFFFGLVAGLIKGYHVALIILGCVPLLAISGAILGNATTQLTTKSAAAYGKAGAIAHEALTQIKTVWSTNGENRVLALYKDYLNIAKKNGIKMGFFMGGALGTLLISMFTAYAISLWFGSWLISNKIYNPYRNRDYTGGDVMAVLYALIGAAFSLGQAMQFVGVVMVGKAAAGRLYAVIDRKSSINPFDPSGEKPSNPKGELTFENVSFSYESRPDVKVLDHFNLTIKQGMTVALVGPSGCGKSTIISLLERFYDPLADGGKILLDGHDLKSLNVRWLRGQFGLVRQEPSLFNGTIYDNICYGTEGATMDQVIEAAKIAHIHDFIMKQKNGYQHVVGEEGRLLSGGQRQRIAIARAVLKNPLILLLDESTAALDNESERKVQAALDELLKKRKNHGCAIMIAHRLSTVANCDMIVVMDKGTIQEIGTHGQLLAKKGMYYHLVHAQSHQRSIKDTATNEEMKGEKALTLTEEKENHDNIIEVKIKKTDQPQQEPSVSRSEVTFHPIFDPSSPPHPLLDSSTTASIELTKTQPSPPPSDDTVIDIDALEKVKKPSTAAKDTEEKKPTPQLPPNATSRLFAFIRSDWHWLFIGCISSMVNGGVWPAMGRLQAEMIAAFYLPTDEMMDRTRLFAGLFAVLGVVSFIFQILQLGGFAISGERLTVIIRTKLLNRYLRMHQGWHDQKENNSGVLLSRLQTEAEDIQNIIGIPLGTTCQSVALILIGFVMALTSGWKMALVILSVTPVLIFGQFIQFELWFGVNDKKKAAIESAMELASEAISNLRTVVAFGGENRVINHFKTVLDNEYAVTMRSAQVAGLGFGFSQFVQMGLYSLGFWYGATLISRGEYSLDNVFSVYFTIELSTMGLGQAGAQMSRYPPAVTAAVNVLNTLDTKTEIDPLPSDNEPVGEKPQITDGEIVFENVSFHYPTRPNQPILKSFNLKVPARTSLAIVGESGNGKSTIISLLEQFYRPDSGRILVDGQDITKLNVSAYRGHIGLVSQEPVLFNTTVEDNIRFGAKPNQPPPPIDAIIKAAKVANINDFVEKLPQKYQTEIGTKANLNVSGGQKARLCIARSLLREPRILLLDEATAALDNESEALVESALQEASKGVTTIMIAHRLTSIMRSDAIVVLDKGVIAEGPATHDQLLKKNGLYANLWKAQAQRK